MPVAALFLAPTATAAVAISKRKENRRKQALANKYSQKYPLSDDLTTNSSTIAAAQSELRAINTQPTRTASAKRVKQRESSELSKWVAVLLAHGKDLKAGLALATSVTPVMQATPAPTVSAPTPTPTLDGPQAGSPADYGQNAPEIGTEAASEASPGASAAPKKTNWLLIGGIAVGAILLLNFMKKD